MGRVLGCGIRHYVRVSDRPFPMSPRSTRDLRIGDFWAVSLADGDYGACQVVDLRSTGPGSRMTFVVGLVRWRGGALPDDVALLGTQVERVGVCPVEVFAEMASPILGNRPVTFAAGVGSPWSDVSVGAKTSVWGARTVGRKVQELLDGAP